MAPEAVTQKEKTPTVPSFIDEELIKTLSSEKQAYWENRKNGKRGQGAYLKPKFLKAAPDIVMGFDERGGMVAKTRKVRRHKKPTENKYTKATHSIKKANKKNG